MEGAQGVRREAAEEADSAGAAVAHPTWRPAYDLKVHEGEAEWTGNRQTLGRGTGRRNRPDLGFQSPS